MGSSHTWVKLFSLAVCLSVRLLALSLGTVKKCGLFKILHEKFKHAGTGRRPGGSEVAEFRQSLITAAEQNKEIEPYIGKAQVRGRG